jgi:hypothetical protein
MITDKEKTFSYTLFKPNNEPIGFEACSTSIEATLFIIKQLCWNTLIFRVRTVLLNPESKGSIIFQNVPNSLPTHAVSSQKP